MLEGLDLVIYPVTDLAAAKAVYRAALETEPYVDEPYYVGFLVGDQEIGLDPNGHRSGMTGPLGYWRVSDISTSVQRFVDGGAQVHQAVRDVGGGKLTATVKDPDGNVTGLVQLP